MTKLTVTIIAVIVAVTSLTLADEPHWSFRKITRPTPSRVRQADWPRNGSDSFVLARLENKTESVAPSPEADRVTLIRRVTLDLIGLSPTPEEVGVGLVALVAGAAIGGLRCFVSKVSASWLSVVGGLAVTGFATTAICAALGQKWFIGWIWLGTCFAVFVYVFLLAFFPVGRTET